MFTLTALVAVSAITLASGKMEWPNVNGTALQNHYEKPIYAVPPFVPSGKPQAFINFVNHHPEIFGDPAEEIDEGSHTLIRLSLRNNDIFLEKRSFILEKIIEAATSDWDVVFEVYSSAPLTSPLREDAEIVMREFKDVAGGYVTTIHARNLNVVIHPLPRNFVSTKLLLDIDEN